MTSTKNDQRQKTPQSRHALSPGNSESTLLGIIGSLHLYTSYQPQWIRTSFRSALKTLQALFPPALPDVVNW